MRTTLLLSPALVVLAACYEPEPTPDERERTELREGVWKFHLDDAVLEGACPSIAGADAAEVVEGLDGLVLPAHVSTPGAYGVRIELEGLSLRGERADGWLSAEGRLDDISPSEPPEESDWGEDTDDEGTDDEDSDYDYGEDDGDGEAPPPCEVVEEPVETEDGISVVVDAAVLDAEHLEGELDIHYSSGEASCVINTRLVGLFVGEPAEPEPCGEEIPEESETGGPDVEVCG